MASTNIDECFSILKNHISKGNEKDILNILHSIPRESLKSIVDDDKNTLVHYFATIPNKNIMAYLISSGCNINMLNFYNKSPLVLAIDYHNKEIVELLLAEGASKFRALHVAVKKGYSDIVELLLKYGASVKDDDNINDTLIFDALVGEYEDKWTCRKRVVELLIEAGADVHSAYPPYYNGSIPLHVAIYNKDINLTKQLIKAGTNVNWVDNFQRCFLHFAAAERFPDAVKLLLERGALVDVIDTEDLDPLCYCLQHWGDYLNGILSRDYDTYSDEYCDDAIESLFPDMVQCQIKCIKLLLDYGANINRENIHGQTPIFIAIRDCNHTKLIRFLMNNGVIFNFHNRIVREVCEGHNGSKYSLLLLRQQAFFEAQNPERGSLNLDEISYIDQSSLEYYKDCKKELELMKKSLIHCSVSFLSILVDQNIRRYAKNQFIRSILENEESTKPFKIYGDMLCQKFFNEIEKQKLINRGIRTLGHILQWDVNGLHLVLDNIVQRLNRKDLHNLIRV